jgi:HEAT repeat protein
MFTKKLTVTLVAATGLFGFSLVAQQPSPLVTKTAPQLIEALKGSGDQKTKADACRELAVIGGKDAVPALAALLTDEKLSHMARYALETIPDPSADAALREALGKTKGRLLVGVIGSLGVRKDAQSIPQVSSLLRDSDPDVAQAAARALGSIGKPEGVQAIMDAIQEVPESNMLAFCEGIGRALETMLNSGQSQAVSSMAGDHYNNTTLPHQVRSAAFRSAVLAKGDEGVSLLLEGVRGEDWILVASAARMAVLLPSPAVTKAFVDELPKLTGDRAIIAIQILGKRGDRAGLPALLTATKNGDAKVRLAAVRAVAEVGDPAAIPVLVEHITGSDEPLAQAARESLASIPGPGANSAVLSLLERPDAKSRVLAIELIGRRRMLESMPALVKAAEDKDAGVRSAAFKRLGEMGANSEVPVLLGLVLKSQSQGDLDAAEQAISVIAGRMDDAAASSAQVAAKLAQARPAQQATLLRILASIGGEAALKSVRTAVDSSNPEVRDAAIRALGNWKTEDAAPYLLELAQTAKDPKEKMLCLRGVLDWASSPEGAVEKRLQMCQKVRPLIQQPEEKKLLLAALGSIKTLDSLKLITPFMADSSTKEEASVAAVGVAEGLLKGKLTVEAAEALLAPLEQAAAAATPGTAQRAKELFQKARTAAQKK